MKLDLGTRIACTDGPFGELVDVVINPVGNSVTHLVVRAHGLDGVARLVPIQLVELTDDGLEELTLRCTVAAAAEFESVERYSQLGIGEHGPDDSQWDVGVEQVLATPYDATGLVQYGGVDGAYGEVYDRVPKGEAELRRDSAVLTSDGNYLGGIEGFVLDNDARITHIVMTKGHLWGRRRVTIPIEAVDTVETDTVTVGLTGEEVGALPSVRIRHWF
jgi:sporulation protein YlmC with PRC-barrel domain